MRVLRIKFVAVLILFLAIITRSMVIKLPFQVIAMVLMEMVIQLREMAIM
jgi:hypothetical protein